MIEHTPHPVSTSGTSGYRRLAIAGAILGAGLVGTALAQSVARPGPARLVTKSAQAAIPDQYIVVFEPGTPATAIMVAEATARKLGGTIGFTYTSALRGFSVKAAPNVVDQLRAISGVSYIEADSIVSASIIQSGPPLGLDRTSERLLPLDAQFTYSSNGTGVHAYVIDTGIRSTHVEFGGRSSGAFTAIADAFGTSDCNGHGTHVAGTIGGTTYGIAKNVQLHSVRVLDCAGNGTLSGVLAGIAWVTSNAIHPAVANMSLGGGFSPTLNSAVASSVASGVTYAVAAGNNFGADACTVSPASEPSAITVGSVNPVNDIRSIFSNVGPCLDLFGPGETILSAWATSDTATNTINGTSMATPHVAGVAALYLQTHTAASPATVWAAIHNAADVSTTAGWPGVINPGLGSPNELLHWGSLNDGYDDGDPHLTTVEGLHYDFQSAGEFVLLREGNGLEIQTRQSPVATASAITNGYTGLTSCVSLNTAVAARVGAHRISYEPNLSGVPDPSGLQLRIDGALTTLGAAGLDLGGGGHLANYGTGIAVDFPDGTTLIVTPNWWSSQSRWYLNVSVFHSQGSEGIIGARPPGSWLPALPSGASMGPMPGTLHQRYLDLNATFANAWRVTAASSLFDYAPGTSTGTFTIAAWPPESPPCVIPQNTDPPVQPLDPRTAQLLCRVVTDHARNDSCVKDVIVTGEAGFADIHRASEVIVAGATRTLLDDAGNPTAPGAEATFTATVARHASSGNPAAPAGAVQFSIDGKDAGAPIKLDGSGQAVWRTAGLEPGEHRITASYSAAQGSVFLPSASPTVIHLVR